MGWSPSALFHEMLLLCIPKLWKQRYRWLNFGSVFSVWSVFFGHLFISFQTFVFFFFFLLDNTCDSSCFQDHVMSSLIRSPVVKTWSRDHTCTRILTRTVFGICSDFCVQVDHVTPHSNWLDFVYFFSRVVFLPMVRLTWGFCTDKINSNNTKLSIRYNVTVEFISPLYDTNTGELLFFL